MQYNMQYKLYTIYDRLSHLHGSPMVQVNDACAKRYFGAMVQGAKDMPTPSDFDLMCVGLWAPESGVITPLEPVLVANGGEFDDGGID